MKKGAFIDFYVDDPKSRDPEFEKTRASKRDYEIGRYITDQGILEKLSKDYKLEIYSELTMAASMITNRDLSKSLDFVITDIPPSKEAERLAKERNVEIRKKVGNLGFREREETFKQILEEEDKLNDKIYSDSLWCITQLRRTKPGIIIIAYTDAPEKICKKCLNGVGVDYVIPRNKYSLTAIVDKIKELIEAGKNE